MRRFRRKSSPPGVSLFPFLAVLICTLGVLIVMLVIAAKSADVAAQEEQQARDQETSRKLETRQQQIDLAEIRLEGLTRMRGDLLDRLELARDNRLHIQEDIRATNRELEQTRAKIAAIARAPEWNANAPSSLDSEIQNAADRVAQLKRQLESERERLDQVKQQAAPGNQKFVILPHQGGGGTLRRPIFIECRKDDLVLQPSGISLLKSEFHPPMQPGNMLDAALLTIRAYWERHELSGSEGRPYPLLVVRPDGAESFVLARRAMRSWDDEFGYELVADDQVIDWGQQDPQLKTEVASSVAEARQRQQALDWQRFQLAQHHAQFADPSSRPGLVAGRHGLVTTAGAEAQSLDPRINRTGWNEGQPPGSPGAGDASSNENSDLRSEFAQTRQPRSRQSATTDSQAAPSQGPSLGGPEQGQGQTAMGSSIPQNLAARRGANWALPSSTQGGTGYLRPIRLFCHADRIELLAGTGEATIIEFKNDPVRAIDTLVESIWDQINDWGIAGAQSYWKPELRITIEAGGEARFRQLESMLQGSGLMVKGMSK